MWYSERLPALAWFRPGRAGGLSACAFNGSGFNARQPNAPSFHEKLFIEHHPARAGSLAAMTTLLLATRNRHKTGEIQAILGPSLRCLTLDDYPGAPPVVEDADSFAGNAAKKAGELARWLVDEKRGMRNAECGINFVLADDSGLEVDALGGAPGVHSARFAVLDTGAAGNSTDAANNTKLLRLLETVPLEKRTARFRCVLALVRIDPTGVIGAPQFFDGACAGRIQFTPGGRGGFGYDPLFVPDGFEKSFAELGEDVKNKLSHRAQALGKLCAWFQRAG